MKDDNFNFSGSVNASGGRGGDSYGNNSGGHGGAGGSIHFVKVGKEFTPEGIAFSKIKNPHKQYWKFVFKKFKDLVRDHKFGIVSMVVVIVLSGAAYFGYVNYTPEFNSLIGTFKLSKDSVHPDSQKLDRSVFDLVWTTINGELTSQERVNLIADISGLETKEEVGVIEDIGTGGLTVLVKGDSTDGHVGILRCDFSSSWKQRLSLFKKSDTMKFKGIVSTYDLSRQWIVLRDCEL